jgi:hypothetical protein
MTPICGLFTKIPKEPEKRPSCIGGLEAGGKGFEPLLTDPESAVLPLDEPPFLQRAVFYHAAVEKSNKVCYFRAARRVFASISMNISKILAMACKPIK